METDQRDVILVQMPNTWLHPSLALGLLKADLNRAGVSNAVMYSSHRFVERLGAANYKKIDELMEMFPGAWEMLFAPFTDFTPRARARDMIDHLSRMCRDGLVSQKGLYRDVENRTDELLSIWDALSEQADAFLEDEAERVLARAPRIVGFSIMTQQRNAALALMKRLKALSPGVVTILGGGSCSGEAGPALLRVAPSLDYCFSGDGDASLGDGCRLLLEGRTDALRERHPEFLSRGDAPVNRAFQDMNACLIPDYTEYFEQIREDTFFDKKDAVLLMEGSRGCWWGEKGRCRFCGLHACKNALRYRSKTPERFFNEAVALSRRYGVQNILLSDTNLDLALIRSLPDTPPPERAKLVFFAECKSNLRPDELRRLKNNGFVSLQPGIESLSDEVLDLMHKGAKTAHQLAFLKYAQQFGIKAFWNVMYGLPQEQASWYDEMFALMAHIHFLPPPTGITSMLLARDSVFWEDHAAYGMPTIRPRVNEAAADPDEAFTWATSSVFVSSEIHYLPGIRDRVWDAVSAWREDYERHARLLLVQLPDRTVIRDERIYGERKLYHLKGLRRKLYDMAYEVVGEKQVFARLASEEGGHAAPEEIEAAISFFTERFLMYRKGGRLLSLAVPAEEDD